MALTPCVGMWYMKRDSSAVAGLCVHVLPSGDQAILALPNRDGKAVEQIFNREDIKGPMRELPGMGSF